MQSLLLTCDIPISSKACHEAKDLEIRVTVRMKFDAMEAAFGCCNTLKEHTLRMEQLRWKIEGPLPQLLRAVIEIILSLNANV